MSTLSTTVYFALFPDRGVYSCGPQVDSDGLGVPGGILGFEDREMAQRVAEVISGEVEARALNWVLDNCKRNRITLYIRWQDGLTSVIHETIPDEPGPPLIRVEGEEREALIALEEGTPYEFGET